MEIDRLTVRDTDDDRSRQGDRAEHDEPDERPYDVHESLDGQTQLVLLAGDQRADHEPLELLLAGIRQGDGHGIDRHANRLALVCRQPRH